MDAASELARRGREFDESLQRYFDGRSDPRIIGEAMSYSLFAPSKRLRPVLLLASAELFEGSAGSLPLAAGVEMIHTYSLIHDDLPCMDDDDTRRGKPSSHVVFGYPIAVLAGDALLNAAFEVMISGFFAASKRTRYMRALEEIARSSGYRGMIAGQAADVSGSVSTRRDVEFVSSFKTGALIAASVAAGAMMGGASSGELASMRRFGEETGLMFQIVDDLADYARDREGERNSWPAVVGEAEARREAALLADSAAGRLAAFGKEGDFLVRLVRFLAAGS
jgi:geranylgeranyl diphosphate synthase type II